MKRSYIGLALGALVAVGAVLSLPSCGHDQKLVSLAVHPASPGFTFPVPTAGATGQYTAIASYIHPPATKDVTSQATWAVDDQVVSINAGLVTTNGSCGSADVSATMPEGTGGASNIVIGYSFVTVQDTTNPHCPGGSATNGQLVVTLAGNGVGTVTSQPAGISCPGSCGALFPTTDSPITLTAAAGGNSTFASWSPNCTVGSNPNQCSVPLVGGGIVTVTATFNSP
jgi:trimeric autotransporter adhesin